MHYSNTELCLFNRHTVLVEYVKTSVLFVIPLFCLPVSITISSINIHGINCCSGNAFPSVRPQECFNFNLAGTRFGNCGHNISEFVACSSA